jgi:RTX calcium-binding nonapeptide repeat (4 copies)
MVLMLDDTPSIDSPKTHFGQSASECEVIKAVILTDEEIESIKEKARKDAGELIRELEEDELLFVDDECDFDDFHIGKDINSSEIAEFIREFEGEQVFVDDEYDPDDLQVKEDVNADQTIQLLGFSFSMALIMPAILSRSPLGSFQYSSTNSAQRWTDLAIAESSTQRSTSDQNLIPQSYTAANIGLTNTTPIVFPVGDLPSEIFDLPEQLELQSLEIDLRPALGSMIPNPLRSAITSIAANVFGKTTNLFVDAINPTVQKLDPQRSPWVYPTYIPEISRPERLPEADRPVRYPTTEPQKPNPTQPILQTTIWDGAGDQKIFEIGYVSQPHQYVIYNFGMVGKGADPTIEIRKEIDALKFIGDGFTPDKLQLKQLGRDLVITFTGNEFVEIILKDRQRQDFDNLGLKPIKGIDPNFGVGNILFNNDRIIRDNIDVIDAVLPNPNSIIYLFNPNTTTFLNDQNNLVQGFNNSNDIIRGLAGNDVIFGLSGDDRLYGDDGNDILFGNAGNNILTGGSGADLFAISPNGFSRVTDFNVHEGDRIGLTDGLTVDRLSFETEVTANGSTTWISDRFTNRRLMELPGITSNVLNRDLFIPISSQITDYRH